jgi:hypothetical protein
VQGFGLDTLALLTAVGFAGPLKASLPRLRIPVIVGELIAGLVVGKTGFGLIDVANPTFQLLANIGFALWRRCRRVGQEQGTTHTVEDQKTPSFFLRR